MIPESPNPGMVLPESLDDITCSGQSINSGRLLSESSYGRMYLPDSSIQNDLIPESPSERTFIPDTSNHRDLFPEIPSERTYIPDSARFHHRAFIPEIPSERTYIPDSTNHRALIPESPLDRTYIPDPDTYIPEQVPVQDDYGSHVRIFRTFATGVLVFCVGITGSILGPTLVNLRELLSTNTMMMSVAVSMHHAGLLAGTLMSGCLFQRFNSELQFFILTILSACCFVSAPWFSTVYGFTVMMALFGCIIAYVDAGGKVYILSLWENKEQKNAILLTLHFVWCLGSILSPFLQKPFLVNQSNSSLQYQNESINTTHTTNDERDVTRVRYAYMLLGSCILLASILFFIIYTLTCSNYKKNSKDKLDDKKEDRDMCFIITFAVFLFTFSFLLLVGIVTGAYLSMFVVDGLGWTVKKGAIITSTYYGALGIGILLAIPLSYILIPRTVLNLCLTLQCFGYAIMLTVENHGPELMYASVAITGLGNSVIFPNLLLWVSSFYHLSGTVTIVITGASTGVISGIPLLGNLIKLYGHMWFVYFLLAASALLIIISVLMQFYVYKKIKPKHSTLQVTA